MTIDSVTLLNIVVELLFVLFTTFGKLSDATTMPSSFLSSSGSMGLLVGFDSQSLFLAELPVHRHRHQRRHPCPTSRRSMERIWSQVKSLADHWFVETNYRFELKLILMTLKWFRMTRAELALPMCSRSAELH